MISYIALSITLVLALVLAIIIQRKIIKQLKRDITFLRRELTKHYKKDY